MGRNRKRHSGPRRREPRPNPAPASDDADRQDELQFEDDLQDSAADSASDPDEPTQEPAPEQTTEEAAGANGGMLVPVSMLREAEKQRDDYLDLARRTQADLENYRKRVARENAEMKRAALGSFLRDCLPHLHDLDRALAEGEQKHEYETFHTGIKLVRENLWKTLSAAGVQPIEALGKPFDPNEHEALTTLPNAEVEPNTVLEVFQAGYKLDDFVLLPARVIVSRSPDQ